MTDEELAAQEAAEAEESTEQTAAEEVTRAPAPPSKQEIADMIAEATERARAEWEAAQAQVSRRTVATNDEDAELERLAKLAGTDFNAYQREVLRIAVAQAEARIDAKYGSRLRPIETNTVVSELATGLNDKGREYIAKYAPQIDPQDLNKETKDILRRAARDYEREHTVVRENVVRTHGDPPQVKTEDKKMADFFAGLASAHAGISADDVKLTDDDLREIAAMGDDRYE